MGKKKIAFYCGSLIKGGAERVFVNLAEYFYSEGYDVCMITQYKKEDEYVISSGIERVLSDLTEKENGKSRIRNFFRRFRKLRHILKTVKPDLVLTCTAKSNFMAMAAGTFLKTKVVVSIVADPKMEYDTKAMRLIAKTYFCFADGIVFQTKEARAFFPKYIQKKSVILSNSLNPQFVRARYEGERQKEIVAVGRLDDNKNHEMLIRAFAQIADKFPEHKLTIFGEGECRGKLEVLIAKEGLSRRVSLPGVTADVAGNIEKAALFVLTSNTEGMPNTLLEAMALGLTVISTDCPCGGPRELIMSGENGLLIPVGEVKALADAMEKVLANPTEAEKMGRNAWKLQEKLKPEVTNQSWKEYFNGIMTKERKVCDMSARKMSVAALVLMFLSLIPLLALGFYNKMCYDDYVFGAVVHSVWNSTGSFMQTIEAAARQADKMYREWQGCWLITFLNAIYPANYNYQLAFIVPFLSIGLFVTSVFAAGKQLFIKWLKGERRQSVFVIAVLLFLFYQIMDSPFEGLYWYNGVIAYIFPQSFCFFATAAIIELLCAEKKKIICCMCASICTIIAAAGNYVTALQMEILIVFFTIYMFIKKKKKLCIVIIPCLTGTISFLVNVLAPGNLARGVSAAYESYGPVSAILLSFYYAMLYMIKWTPTIVILAWIALLPVLWRIVRDSKKNFEYHPIFIMLGAFSLLSAMFTPSLYAMGQAGLPRINNIIQMIYYLSLLVVTAYWMGWISHKKQEAVSMWDTCFGKIGNRMTVIAMMLVLFICCFTMDKNTYNSVSAVRSIVKGEARSFHEESMERYALYLDAAQQDVVLQPYSARPALFNITDLSQEADNWMNTAVAAYFSKKSVVVASDEQSDKEK